MASNCSPSEYARSHEWEFVIRFCDHDLPPAMCYVDVAAMYGYLPDIPDETGEWMWAFTICKGRERTATGQEVQTHCGLLLDLMNANYQDLVNALLRTGRDREEVERACAQWQDGLTKVVSLARAHETCTWIEGEI